MINFKELNISDRNIKKNVFSFNGKDITVISYLPTSEKNDLIEVTLAKSWDGNIYNPILLDMYFHLNILYSYTDILFDAEDREDDADLFDAVLTNGLLEQVLNKIDQTEYDTLQEMLETHKKELLAYKMSIPAMINSFVDALPKNADMVVKMLKDLKSDDFKELKDIVNTVNTTFNMNK